MWLLASYGLERILDLLGRAGWLGIVAVIAFHLVQLLFSASAWRTIAGPMTRRPSLLGFCVLRWIREGVNNLLPVAQIGGEFVVARLMQRRGVPLAPAIAGTVADLTMEMVTQIAFTLLGLGLLLRAVGGGAIADTVTGFVLVAALVAAAFLGAQWFGLASAFERLLMRVGRAIGWAGTAQVEGLHQALLACYPRSAPPAAGHDVAQHLVAARRDRGLPSPPFPRPRYEPERRGQSSRSLGQALKAAGFAVPGALGVQEGGYIVICQAFGLAPEVAIALSLIKRLREVVLGVPGLVAWQFFSGRDSSMISPALETAP